jgi:hypothetical protein
MLEVIISEELEKFREPSHISRNVALLIYRSLPTISKLLFKQNTDRPLCLPQMPVAARENRLAVAKEMVENINGTGRCSFDPQCYEWGKGRAGNTDYFFIEGINIKTVEGYKWHSVLWFGENGLPEGQEGSELLERLYSKPHAGAQYPTGSDHLFWLDS